MPEKAKISRKKQAEQDSLVVGKIPPQNVELESSVLGCCMLEKKAFEIVSENLKQDYFYAEANKLIYAAMLSIYNRSGNIDLMTVVDELKKSGNLDLVGGPFGVSKLTNSVVSSAHLSDWCEIIREKYLKREQIRIGMEMLIAGYDETADIKSSFELAASQIIDAVIGKVSDSVKSAETVLMESLRAYTEMKANPTAYPGIRSGFTDLDNLTGGWQKSDLILLAARPSVGKTAFGLNIAWAAAASKKSVLLFSIEMTDRKLMNRILSMDSGVFLEKIQRGMTNEYDDKLVNLSAERISVSNLFFDDSSGLTPFDVKIRAKSINRELRRKGHGEISLILIDYIQLMKANYTHGERYENRNMEVSRISSDLKKVAKDLNIPIIALSQLSRAPESRSGQHKEPQLSDLRDSGSLEQDADVVMLMYRPEYYGDSINENGENRDGETHIRIAKQRDGNVGKVILKANLAIQKFTDWTPDGFPQIPQKSNWKPISLMNEDKPF